MGNYSLYTEKGFDYEELRRKVEDNPCLFLSVVLSWTWKSQKKNLVS